MKNYEVKFLSTAYLDIAEIIPNITDVSASWANNFIDELEQHTSNLETMPKMYAVYEDILQ